MVEDRVEDGELKNSELFDCLEIFYSHSNLH